MTIDQLIEAAQSVLDGLKAMKDAGTVVPVTTLELDEIRSDGTVGKFFPSSVPPPPPPPPVTL